MKHLVLMSTSFPDLTPGSEAAGSFVADFAVALSHDLRVTVIAPSLENSAVDYDALHVRRFAVPFLPLSLLDLRKPRHWPWIIRTVQAGQRALTGLAQEDTIDHIFALWALPPGFWARSVGKKQSIPYSVWALGSDIWSLARIPVVKNVIRTVFRDCAVSFADGYLLQQDVERISGRPCTFLPSTRRLPVNGEKQCSEGPPYRLAYLGRWHPNKGTDILCKALGMLTDEDWQCIAEVRIFGGGPLEQEVRTTCSALRAAGRPVAVGGYIDKQEAAELLLWADYMLIPSRIESIPVVFSDALQAKCPVVATPVGDLPRLLEKWRVGILATEPTADSFVQALRDACTIPPFVFAQDLEQAAQAFDLAAAARKFMEETGLAIS